MKAWSFLDYLSVVFLFAVFLICCAIIGKKIAESSSVDLVTGFFGIVILIGIPSISAPIGWPLSARFWFSLYLTASIFLLVRLLPMKGWLRKNTPAFFGLVAILLIYSFTNLSDLRFHATPDNQGFGGAVSYLSVNSNFAELQVDFMKATGLNQPIMQGQQTPILKSTWNIPDYRLLSASDQVIGSGRIGIPAVIATLWTWLDPVIGFTHLLILFSIFGAWATANESTKLALRTMRLLDWQPGNFYSRFGHCIRIAMTCFVAISPMFTTMIVEGQAAQLWLLAALAYQVNFYFDSNNNFRTCRKSFLAESVAPIFVALIYPWGIIPMTMIVSMGYVLQVLSTENKFPNMHKTVITKIIVVFIPVLIAWRLIGVNFFLGLFLFAKNSVGAPYNLGLITLTDSFFYPGSSLIFTNPASGTGGFKSFLTTRDSALTSIIIFTILFLLANFVLIFKFPSKTKIVLLITATYFLFLAQPVRLLWINPPVNSYFYIRGLQFVLVLSIPIAVGVILFAANCIFSIRRRFGQLFLKVVAVLVVAQFSGFIDSASAFNSSSAAFGLNGSKELRNYKLSETIFFSDVPEHPISGLMLYGTFYYLTNNWEPRLSDKLYNGRVFRCAFIDLKSGDMTVTDIGSLTILNTLDGPITVQELSTVPGFIPNKNFDLIVGSINKD